MEPAGSPFSRPPSQTPFSAPRSRFGPLPAAPLTVSVRGTPAPRAAARGRGAAGPRKALARARRHGVVVLYVVAALALLGGALALTGHDPGVVVGLAMARFTERLADPAGSGGAAAALAHATAGAGFALLGRFAQRGRFWALAVGAAVYALDGLIVLAWHDWVGLAIHTAALVMIVRGLDAGRRLS